MNLPWSFELKFIMIDPRYFRTIPKVLHIKYVVEVFG